MSARLDADVLVIGGGPVGLAAAIEARLVGLSVIVVEPRTAPIDKACGEGLMPGSLAALERLGVDPPGHRIVGISYRDRHRHAEHEFAAGLGRGVRRTALHTAMVARGLELGVEQVTGRLGTVKDSPGMVEAAGVRARWLLACDGLHSTVRRRTGLQVPPERPGRLHVPSRYGLRRHFVVPAWTDFVEVYWGRHAEAYVTPVAEDLVGIALLGPRSVDYDAALTEFPELVEHLAGARAAGPVRGAGPLRQRSVRRTIGNVRLVGDASGYVDALTGEGLRVGFAQAAAAIAHLDDPAGYERAWAHVTRDYWLLTTGLLAWASSPARRAIVPVAHRAPAVFGKVVNAIAG
ncbi:MAG: NAD(P)/FAD-dependent oxidoreductase [Cellulomonas sp.]|nr:NAD(P)/FAD-dependent oxidoreductase [Cellulomonas sp.]